LARDPEDIALSRLVDEKLARANEFMARAGGRPGNAPHRPRSRRSLRNRLIGLGVALVALFLATSVIGIVIDGIRETGVFVVGFLLLAIILGFSLWPEKRVRRVPFTEQVPTRTVIEQLDHVLDREGRALPYAASRHAEAIRGKLPLLESRLGALDPVDPLNQDARRLMGLHLPELIERYERVPAAYRSERDGEGMTVDERLTASLAAADEALGDIGARLARQDRDAFETQGRFIESRYRDPRRPRGS
jgi:hypothetical protein